MISKEGSPGTTAEQERLHECPLSLDGVVQIVSRPRMQQLRQRDDTQLRMLFGPSQVVIPHLFEQEQAFLSSAGERCSKLLRSLCIKVCVLLIWIEIDKLLSCQKSAEADRKDLLFCV